ncbi:hypothetical protein [Ideonella sp. A 288]|uniref:hypothetical protein n=1 Tax=Ideonella sp. A 288 TaxID=1962181 RepID=UPI001184A674|nr:hypothetical protein [Ideonella sp. A 288]
MSHTRSVALLGFTRFERETFESFFRLARKREPAYALETSLSRADFIIADADDAAACATLERRHLLGHTVLLGAVDRPGSLLHLPRPINLVRVMRALDAVPRRARAGELPSPAPATSGGPSQLRPLATPAAPRPETRVAPQPTTDDAERAASRQAQRVLNQLAYQTGAIPAHVDVRAMAESAARAAVRAAESAAPCRPVERGDSRFDVPRNLQSVDLDLSEPATAGQRA